MYKIVHFYITFFVHSYITINNYTEVYNSLIFNEDENNPMFIRLKELIDEIFNNKDNDEYVKNIIFKDNIEEYNKLRKIHYRKE